MLLDTLRGDQLAARKARDEFKRTALTILLNDAEMIGKNDGNRKSSDEEVVRAIRKRLKEIADTRELVVKNTTAGSEANVSALAKLDAETTLIDSYLPKQMTEDELTKVITEYRDTTEGANIGGVMKFLKMNYLGKYDGRMASTITAKVLA